MRFLTTLAALALSTIAAPAFAGPQWIQISADGTQHANYNSLRGTGRVRSIDVSVADPATDTTVTFTSHIDCTTWQQMATYQGKTIGTWSPLGKDTAAEATAYLICPR